MKTSVSHLKRHMECPMKAHYEHVMLRGPVKKSEPLIIGTLWHDLIAARLEGRRPLLAPAVDALEFITPEELDEWNKAAADWPLPEDWETHAIEVPLSLKVGKHTLVGTADHIIKWNGSFWHNQHKTLDYRRPLSMYQAQQEVDWHEAAYKRMGEAAGFVPWGGTYLDIFIKLSAKGKREGRSPYIFTPLPVAESTTDDAIADIEQLMDEIEAQYLYTPEGYRQLLRAGMVEEGCELSGLDWNRRIVKNRQACVSYGVCPFLEVCNHRKEIGDGDFVNLPQRYGARPGDSGVSGAV